MIVCSNTQFRHDLMLCVFDWNDGYVSNACWYDSTKRKCRYRNIAETQVYLQSKKYNRVVEEMTICTNEE